jgi:hypothetical protein
MEKKDNIVSLKKFKEKEAKEINARKKEESSSDIEWELKLLRGLLDIPENSTELEVYEAVLKRVEKLRE